MPKIFSKKLTHEIRFSSFLRFFAKSQKKFQKVSPDDITRFADRYFTNSFLVWKKPWAICKDE